MTQHIPLSTFRAFAPNARCIKPWTSVTVPASEQKTEAPKWIARETTGNDLVRRIRNGR